MLGAPITPHTRSVVVGIGCDRRSRHSDVSLVTVLTSEGGAKTDWFKE